MLLVMRRLVGGHHRVVPLGIRRFRRWQRQRSLRFKVSHADFGSRTGRFTAVAVGWLTVMVHNCNQSPGPGPQKGREMRWIRVDIIQEIIRKKEKKKEREKQTKEIKYHIMISWRQLAGWLDRIVSNWHGIGRLHLIPPAVCVYLFLILSQMAAQSAVDSTQPTHKHTPKSLKEWKKRPTQIPARDTSGCKGLLSGHWMINRFHGN